MEHTPHTNTLVDQSDTNVSPPADVSVIVPLFNKVAYVNAAIQSVLSNADSCDGLRVEVIVVDDGSTDGSDDVVYCFGDRVTLLRQANAGPAAARNRGILSSTGSLLAFLDADDVWMPDKLKTQVSFMMQHPDIGWSCVNVVSENNAGQVCGHLAKPIETNTAGPQWRRIDDWFAASVAHPLARTSAVMVRRPLIEKVGLFDATIFSGQDMDLWIRLARECRRFAFCDQPLVRYRSHVPGAITTLVRPRFASRLRYLSKYLQQTERNGTDSSMSRFLKVRWMDLLKASIYHGLDDLALEVVRLTPQDWRCLRWNLWTAIARTPFRRAVQHWHMRRQGNMGIQ